MNQTSIKCYFCKGNHLCRNCPIEVSVSEEYKNKVGMMMEYYIAENFNCPECNEQSLCVLGNHTPSLDIICNHCSKLFEVKSKCLSVQTIPQDINLNHGCYYSYMNRLADKLNLFVVIYGADRVTKNISIREILYANNSLLLNSKIIEVKKNNNSSTIIIKQKNYLKKMLVKKNRVIKFDQ